jgi:hypothetical protein
MVLVLENKVSGYMYFSISSLTKIIGGFASGLDDSVGY